MTEKFFAATPYLCLDEVPDYLIIEQTAIENFIRTYG